MTYLAAAILPILSIACIIFCYNIAKKRGASPGFWALMAALFGPFAIPFAMKANPSGND